MAGAFPRRTWWSCWLVLAAGLAVVSGQPGAPGRAAAATAPQLTSPEDGALLPEMTATLQWDLPAGSTQFQLQVVPFGADGPGIGVVGSAANAFTVPPPPAWYGLLPDMTYSWRVQATAATAALGPSDPAWGAWSDVRSFRTPRRESDGLLPVTPANGATVGSGPQRLQWQNRDRDVFYYEVQVSTDPTMETDPARATAAVWWNLVHGGMTAPADSWLTPPLAAGAVYYWRVRPRVQGDGQPVAWSTMWSFETAAQVSHGAVRVTTDRASYRRGETVVVTIENGLPAPVYGSRYGTFCTVVSAQRQVENGWQQEAPCTSPVPPPLEPLAAGARTTVELAAAPASDTGLPDGRYRIEFRYTVETPSGSQETAHSAEFVITDQ